MKILHVGKFYSPIEGGIESINRVVVDSMKGNQQRVVSFNNNDYSIEEDVDNIPIIRASSKGILARQPISWIYFRELNRAIKLFNPDIIHFHYPNPLGAIYLLLSITPKNKLVVHWHSDIVAQRAMKPFITPIENKLLNRANSIITTSPTYCNASSNISRFKDKTTIIPCSIDENRFVITAADEESIRTIRNKYNNKPIIFFVGRHVEYKGITFLLKAEKLVNNDCVFLIAGHGPLTAELKSQYNSERIHWLGRISDEELKLYYHAASIFAFPSITRNEAFGVVLAESMYCHCPSVTFSIEGSGVNWVSPNGETSIEVPNKDYKAFASAIDKLLPDKTLRQKLSENAHLRAQKYFSKKVVEEQYRDLYRRLSLE